jgi:ribonuclease VapC
MAGALQRAEIWRVSAVAYVETAVVTDSNRNPVLSRRLDDLLRDAQIQVESVTPKQAEMARYAYRDFGKGRHKAGLNPGGLLRVRAGEGKGGTFAVQRIQFWQNGH